MICITSIKLCLLSSVNVSVSVSVSVSTSVKCVSMHPLESVCKGTWKTTHSPGLVYIACTSVCTLPTPELCEYIGLCVLHRVSENYAGNMEQVIGQRGMLCPILFDMVAFTCRVIKTPVLSHHFYYLLDTFSHYFRYSKHIGRFTSTGTRREGNLCTKDQYPHAVTACTVYVTP